MAALGDLVVRVGANISSFKSAMTDVSKEINRTVTSSQKAFSGFDRLGDTLKNVGTQMTAGITLPIVAAGAAAFKFASDFDGAMRQVTSLIGSVSQQEFKQLSDQTLELSRNMGVDAVDSAHALYEALSANIPKENVMSFLGTATGTAIAGLTSTEVAVDGLTTVINSYGLSAQEAASVSDAMFTAVNFGKVTFEELASTVGIAASSAKTMGISYDELLATMAAITLQGRSSSEAFTEIQSAMKALLSPNKDMNELLDKTGYSSAQALIGAKGFAGALQELNKAADGNAAALNDAFGRIEGYNAMLHVTGPGAEVVAKSIGLMNDKLGATAKAQAEIEQSAPRMWERFKSQLEAVAISAGQQLLPAFQSILTNMLPLVEMLGDAVKWFSELPGPVQTFALGLIAAGAAMGPLIAVGGQLLSSFSLISKTVTLLPGLFSIFSTSISNIATAVSGNMVGALTAGETILLRMGQAAILAGAAFASFKIGQWLSENIPMLDRFSQWFSDLLVKIPGVQSLIERFTGVTAAQARATENAAFILQKQEQALAQHGITISKAGKSQEEYNAAVSDAVKKLASQSTEISALNAAIKNATTAQEKERLEKERNTKALEAQKKAQDALNEALSKANSNLTTVEGLWKSGKVSIDAVRVAQQEAEKAQNKWNDAFLRAHPELNKLNTGTTSFSRAVQESGTRLLEMGSAMDKASQDAIEFDAAMEALGHTLDITGTINVPELMEGIGSLPLPLYTAADAMRELGVASSSELGRSADAASAALETIQSDTSSTTGEIQAAWKKTMEAQIAYARSLGDNQTADALQRQLDAHTQHGSKVQTIWQRTSQQISTIVSDMGKKFADGIFKLFDNSENDKLDQQMADLRSQLDDATTAYNDHVAEVSAKLADIPGAYDLALTDLASITNQKLESMDAEYADSINKIKSRFDDVTKSAAKQLDKQLKDIDDQLKDKKKNYDRSTQDANTSYKRDTENLRESLDDKEREYRQWVEEQEQNLRQLEGDNSASAQRQREDIKLAMQHRAEDMEDTRADIQAALLREEEDLALSLKRKQEDYAEDVAELKAKQEEARDNYKQTLADAEEDLKTSLAERQTEYDSDKKAALDTYEAAKLEIIKKYEDQTAALKTELGKALDEYDAYKLGIDGKLKTLEDAHKGPLDRIKGLFTDVFSAAGEALLRFAGEEVMGLLIGKLGQLIGMIPGLSGIGTALSGVLGGGASSAAGAAGSAAGSVVSAGSSAGSAAGSAASGVMGAIGAIGSIGTLVTSVLSMMGVGVQGNMSDSLKGIHNDTTYLAKAFGDMGLKDSIQGGMNDIKAYVTAYSGWVHDSWVELLDNTGKVKEDTTMMRSFTDDMNTRIGEIKTSIVSYLPELTAIKLALQTTPPPVVNVYVQGDLPNLVTTIKTEIIKGMQLQGAGV